MHDVASSIVFQTSLANIDSVMIAGQWCKREGRLLGVNLRPLIERLQASGQRIASALGLH